MPQKKITPIETASKRKQKQKLEFETLLQDIEMIEIERFENLFDALESERVFERASVLPRSMEVDIVAWISEKFGLDYKLRVAVQSALEEIRRERGNAAKREKTPKATREDYVALASSVLGEIRRDIFTGKLHFRNDEGIWVPIKNEIERLQSECMHETDKGDMQFAYTQIEKHLAWFEGTQDRQLIIDIPAWDGVDRIKAISDSLVLDGTQEGFDEEVVEYFVKQFMFGVFAKFHNPQFRQRIIILKGPQNIGKDWWIDALVGGFGQWCADLTITRDEKDNLLQLSNAAVLKIAEFDRTAKTEVSSLKHMLTADRSSVRAPFERAATIRFCRASFISSCNIDDIFRDPTGHSRYIPINLKQIRWDYPRTKEDKAQVLAQAQEVFSKSGGSWKRESRFEDALKKYIDSKTPQSFEDEVVERFDEIVAKWCQENPVAGVEIRESGFVSNERIADEGILGLVAKEFGVSENVVRRKLALKDRQKRTKKSRGYVVQGLEGDAICVTDDAMGDIPF